MGKITWSAKNDSYYLNGQESAKSVRAAVIAARHYLENEMMGYGRITIYEDGEAIRQDEKSIWTSYRWRVTKI